MDLRLTRPFHLRNNGVLYLMAAMISHGAWLFGESSPRSAQEILAQTRAASGGENWGRAGQIVSEGELQTHGLTAQIHFREDGRHGRSILRYEIPSRGIKGSEGSDGSQSWQQDQEGYISLSDDQASVQDAISNAYLTRRGYFEPDFGGAGVQSIQPIIDGEISYDRITIRPKDGREFTLWINSGTHLIERIEHGSPKPSIELWSDYRDADGVRLPFKIIQKGEAAQETSFTARKISSEVHEGDFAIPFQNDYHFSQGSSTTVPFFGWDGVYLNAMINGHGPYTVVLDSGAVNLISADLVKELGSQSGEQLKLGAFGGDVEAIATQLHSVQIGNLTLRDQDFVVTPFPYPLTHSWREPVVALIGYQTLRRLVVQIDYEHSQLTLSDGGAFRYAGTGSALPLQIRNQNLEIEGAVDGIPGTFDLDTGQTVALTMYTGFAAKHDLVRHYGAHFRGVSGEGYGGLTHAYFARVGTLDLAGVQAHALVTNLSTDTQGESANEGAGNVGTGFFKQFTVTLDCIHHKLFLEKNSNYGRKDIFNRVGIVLQLTTKGAKIVTVLEGSPAAAAGLLEGDVITALDGVRHDQPDFSEHAFYGPTGKIVHVEVESGEKKRQLDLILRDVL